MDTSNEDKNEILIDESKAVESRKSILPDLIFHGRGVSSVGKDIRSSNYKSGQSGWALKSNGNVEFNGPDQNLITAAERTKLAGIEAGAEVNVNADWDSTSGDSQILNKPSLFAPADHASDHVTGGGDVIADAVAAGASGLMSGADKTKLNGIEAGAEVNNISDANASDLTDGEATTLHKHSYNNLNDKPALDRVLIDGYEEANAGAYTEIYNGAFAVYFGQSFSVAVIAKLLAVKFYLSKYNSPTGNIVVQIYAHTGTYGNGGLPTGSVLATSDNLDISTLTASGVLYTFNFSGANQIYLQSGVKYFAIIYYNGGNSSNKLQIWNDTSSPAHLGNIARSTDGAAWIAMNTWDLVFYVYGTQPALT